MMRPAKLRPSGAFNAAFGEPPMRLEPPAASTRPASTEASYPGNTRVTGKKSLCKRVLWRLTSLDLNLGEFLHWRHIFGRHAAVRGSSRGPAASGEVVWTRLGAFSAMRLRH